MPWSARTIKLPEVESKSPGHSSASRQGKASGEDLGDSADASVDTLLDQPLDRVEVKVLACLDNIHPTQ